MSEAGEPQVCECGEPDTAQCRRAFDAALAAEFGDPAYFPVHHLTVAAYQVQHPQAYPSSTSFEVLRRFLDDGVPPHRMRADVNHGRVAAAGGGARLAGTLPISGVRFDDPATYRADVERYARSVLDAARSAYNST